MSRRRQARQATLFTGEADGGVAVEDLPLELPIELHPAPLSPAAAAQPAAAPAPLRARLLAGALDLGFHLLVAATALIGASLLDVPLRVQQLPGFAVLVLVVSLFYTVVPLAFWGRTPGMAATGLACRGDDGQPLAFAEAGRRWLGSLLTVLLLGLPALLLVAGGRSLADRMSGRLPARD